MAEHQIDFGTADVEFGASSQTVGQRTLSDEQWTVYNCLRDRAGPIDLSTLAGELVEKRRRTWKQKALSDGTNDEDADRVEIRLHHVVLPSLAALDVLSYDPSRKEAAPPDGSSGF